jgi:hypothetical protein
VVENVWRIRGVREKFWCARMAVTKVAFFGLPGWFVTLVYYAAARLEIYAAEQQTPHQIFWARLLG